MQRTRFRTGKRLVLGFALGLSVMVLSLTSSQTVVAQSGAQNDPAWDYGRGGSEVPGQPACYLPSGSDSNKKMYSLVRPSCFAGHMQ